MRDEYNISELNPRKNPYANRLKKQITINIDGSPIDYFKSLAAHGSYRRDGDKIRREADDGSRLIDFLVYNGKITNSYYTAD